MLYGFLHQTDFGALVSPTAILHRLSMHISSPCRTTDVSFNLTSPDIVVFFNAIYSWSSTDV